jgi:hypothetical protein
MQLPPWLQINPMDYLQAAEAGTRAGISLRQTADSERERQARQNFAEEEFAAQEKDHQDAVRRQAQEFSAGQGLQRDKLMADVLQARQRRGEAIALNQAKMEQAATLAANRNDLTEQRNTDLAAFQRGQLDSKSDLLDLKQKIAELNASGKTPFHEQEKLKYLYTQLLAANTALPVEKDLDKKGALVGTINALKRQIAALAPPAPAATSLQQTGAPALPDVPAAGPSPNFPQNPLADSKLPSGNYSAPEFQSKAASSLQSAAPTSKPSKAAIDYLNSNLNDPAVQKQFVAKYGQAAFNEAIGIQ